MVTSPGGKTKLPIWWSMVSTLDRVRPLRLVVANEGGGYEARESVLIYNSLAVCPHRFAPGWFVQNRPAHSFSHTYPLDVNLYFLRTFLLTYTGDRATVAV